MARAQKPLFISLFWKATIGLAAILLALVALSTLFNDEQLESLHGHNQFKNQQRLIIEYNGLVNNQFFQLSNLIDSVTLLIADNSQSLEESLEKHFVSLQITWDLQNLALFHSAGDLIKQWGNTTFQPDPNTVRHAIRNGRPIKSIKCLDQCFIVVTSPVIDQSGEIKAIQISSSLADIMLDFNRATGTDIGFITKSNADNTRIQRSLGARGWQVASLTNIDLLYPMLDQFTVGNDWLSPKNERSQQETFSFITEYSEYEIIRFATPELIESDAYVIFVTETTATREQIRQARLTNMTMGTFAGLVTLGLALLVLWRPIRSIQRQSQTLPLLPQGKYDEAKKNIERMSGNKLFPDEISHLKRTSMRVTDQLESYHRELTKNSKELYQLAHFDHLTGLANRTHLLEQIDARLSNRKDQDKPQHFAVIYLDLDNFKHINDALGHEFGDKLRKIVADRLRKTIRKGDTCARLGGDEFCLVLNNIDSQSQASEFAQFVLNTLIEPVNLEGRNFSVSTSIGITLSPLDGEEATGLLQNADLAMYQAKKDGKNKFYFFSDQLHKDADTRIALEEELHRAVKEKEFELFYQPQIDLRTQKLIGCEALIRWNHPERGILSPFFFVDALESNGLIIPVGKWVISEACKQASRWNALGLEGTTISVNLSTRQFSDPDLINDVRKSIEESKISPAQLELEVTESLLATDIKHATDLLKSLQNLGLTIAIDDFGTGYSSLSYLKQLPLDKLKVDRAFIKDLPNDQDDKQITTAIIAMAHSLNLNVVAEGVETGEQQDFLKGLSCEYAQGYHIGRPVCAAEFMELACVKPSIKPIKKKL